MRGKIWKKNKWVRIVEKKGKAKGKDEKIWLGRQSMAKKIVVQSNKYIWWRKKKVAHCKQFFMYVFPKKI